MLQRQPDAALAAVWMLHDRMEPSLGPARWSHGQAPLRIAHHRVLYLDDIGTPVSQHRTRRRRVRELRDLEHTNAPHR